MNRARNVVEPLVLRAGCDDKDSGCSTNPSTTFLIIYLIVNNLQAGTPLSLTELVLFV